MITILSIAIFLLLIIVVLQYITIIKLMKEYTHQKDLVKIYRTKESNYE